MKMLMVATLALVCSEANGCHGVRARRVTVQAEGRSLEVCAASISMVQDCVTASDIHGNAVLRACNVDSISISYAKVPAEDPRQ